MHHALSAGMFKTKCLELVEEVAVKGGTIVVTKHGKPVAQIASATATARPTLRGFYKGKMKIVGDIISPIDVEWDAEKE